MKLHLSETFTSIQGEGHLVGNMTHFIRFSGCSVATCPLHPSNSNLCDTDWSPKSTVNGIDSIELLADAALEDVGVGGWVSITGGEPTDQSGALDVLSAAVRRRGMQLQIQTSGSRKVVCPWDWLTVSPKISRSQLRQDYGQELKLVYTGQSLDELIEWYESTKFWFYYLMPTWEDGECNMQETVDAVHDAYHAGARFGMTTQLHKWIGVR